MNKIGLGIILGLLFLALHHYHPEILEEVRSTVPEVGRKVLTWIPGDFGEKQEHKVVKASQREIKPREQALGSETPGADSTPEAPTQVSRSLAKTAPPPAVQFYPLWTFDRQKTANEFARSIRNRSGVTLKVAPEGYGYRVYIPAENEHEKREKMEQIAHASGIVLK